MIAVETMPSTSTYSEIEAIDSVSPEEFKRKYIKTNTPVLMRKVTANWPALKKWSFEFFANLPLEKKVYLEKNNVLQQQGQYDVMDYRDYVRWIANSSDGESNRHGYLSVFRIFRAFPELEKDVDLSILAQHKLKNTASGWIGPAGTVTGYHIDWGDNVLAQICGRKEVRLVAPTDTKYMYVSPRFDQGTTASQVDVDNYDESRFPLFKKVKQYRVVIHPGEMLFIPRGWWHYVRSLDKSISVSNISYDAKGFVVDLLSQRIKQLLHDIGLYRPPCTCHIVHNGKRVRRNISN